MSAGHPRPWIDPTEAARLLAEARAARPHLGGYHPLPGSRAARRLHRGPLCATECGRAVAHPGQVCEACQARGRANVLRAEQRGEAPEGVLGTCGKCHKTKRLRPGYRWCDDCRRGQLGRPKGLKRATRRDA